MVNLDLNLLLDEYPHPSANNEGSKNAFDDLKQTKTI